MKRVAGRINARYGYATPGDPKPDFPPTTEEKREEKFVKPAPSEIPEIPVFGSTVSIDDKVKTDLGIGTVKKIDGDRVSVSYVSEEGVETENWLDIEKIEKVE